MSTPNPAQKKLRAWTPENERMLRGYQVYSNRKVKKLKTNHFRVASQTSSRKYKVFYDWDTEKSSCTCSDYLLNGKTCKHIWAVIFWIEAIQEDIANIMTRNGVPTDGDQSLYIPTLPRRTYKRNWQAYNKAQCSEKEYFTPLLKDLCATIQEPEVERGKGRPRLPLSNLVFAAIYKVYSGFSARRFMSDLNRAQSDGHVDTSMHFNTIFNTLGQDGLTSVLQELISLSSMPLAHVETAFAVDSTGFASSRFVRWFNIKYGHEIDFHSWNKLHLICGVKTNIVTGVAVTDRHVRDNVKLPELVARTKEHFTINEVSADGGYSSGAVIKAIMDAGGSPYIAFRAATKTTTSPVHGNAVIYRKLYHLFMADQENYLKHYHKRSNVESTFNMIKTKFGDEVRSKTDIAQRNEILCKVLAHNICVLIRAMYELHIPTKYLGTVEVAADTDRNNTLGKRKYLPSLRTYQVGKIKQDAICYAQ